MHQQIQIELISMLPFASKTLNTPEPRNFSIQHHKEHSKPGRGYSLDPAAEFGFLRHPGRKKDRLSDWVFRPIAPQKARLHDRGAKATISRDLLRYHGQRARPWVSFDPVRVSPAGVDDR